MLTPMPALFSGTLFLAGPTREVYWNITGGWIVYIFLAALVAVLLYASYRRIQYYLIVMSVDKFNKLSARLKNFVIKGLG